MFTHTLNVLNEAENLSRSGGGLVEVLAILRNLAMEEFGELLVSMPNSTYPNLSKVLPAMAAKEVQEQWNGASGLRLFSQTSNFVRQFEVVYTGSTGKKLRNEKILDFGCGYGRILRTMYYFSDPDRLWGVDAWDRSLNEAKKTGLIANFCKSEAEPESLPVGDTKFDAAYSFSIFTHLSPKTIEACLHAIRKNMAPGGIFASTIRPIEYWRQHDNARGTSLSDEMIANHLRKS